LGNALHQLYNARKARSPVVSIVGPAHHGAPALRRSASRPISKRSRARSRVTSEVWRERRIWARRPRRPSRAVPHRRGRLATLIGAPPIFRGARRGQPGVVRPLEAAPGPAAASVLKRLEYCRGPEPAGLLLGGGPRLAGAGDCGCRKTGRGPGDTGVRHALRRQNGVRGRAVSPQRLAYFPGAGPRPMLAGLKHIILVECVPPGFIFRIPGAPAATWAPGRLRLPRAGARRAERHGGAWRRWSRNAAWNPLRPPAPDMVRPALPEGAELNGYDRPGLWPAAAGGFDRLGTKWFFPAKPFCGTFLRRPATIFLPITGGAIGQACRSLWAPRWHARIAR